MKNKILTIFFVLIFLAGLTIFLYPVMNNALTNAEKEDIIIEYNDIIEKLSQSDKERLLRDMRQYNQNLFQNKQSGLIDQLSYQLPSFNLAEYSLDNEVFGYISIPSINVKLQIYLGASIENMKKGAVHLSQTSIPIGGENTNAVIAAHRGFRGVEFFKNINKISIGDLIYLNNPWETLTYKVVDIAIIIPSEIEAIYIQEGRSLLTLSSCHPYTKSSHRYLVYCEIIPNSD